MLQQMGYQAGQGLGRSAVGRADPIELSLKAGRTGLGVDEDRKRRQSQIQQQQQDRGRNSSIAAFTSQAGLSICSPC